MIMTRRMVLKIIGIAGALLLQPFRSTLHPKLIEEYSSIESRVMGNDHVPSSVRALHRAWIVAARPHPTEPPQSTMAMNHLDEYFNRVFIDPGLIDGKLYRKFYQEEIHKPIGQRGDWPRLVDEICYYAEPEA